MINVLTYDAPHRKTQDLLFRLKIKGYDNIRVLATPWKTRKNFKSLIPHRKLEPQNFDLKYFCSRLGYDFERIELNALNFSDNDWVLIGGAGILPEEIASSQKIINSHPAYLPYVRGLDSLKWAIHYNKPIGVTTYIISKECDAGKLIRRELVPMYSWDTFHSFANRQFELEIEMLANSIKDLENAPFSELRIDESDQMRRMPHKYETELIEKFNSLVINLK